MTRAIETTAGVGDAMARWTRRRHSLGANAWIKSFVAVIKGSRATMSGGKRRTRRTLDQENGRARNGVAKGLGLWRELWLDRQDQRRGKLRRLVLMIGRQRGVIVIRAAWTRPVGLLSMGVMMSILRDIPGRLFRHHGQRTGMPGPGHEHGESQRQYHCRCQCSAQHSDCLSTRYFRS